MYCNEKAPTHEMTVTNGQGRSVVGMIAVILLSIIATFGFALQASAQCSDQWHAANGVSGGVNPVIFAMTMWDPDGFGPLMPRLVVAGEFTTAGSIPAANIAMWDGSAWSTFGTGMNGLVNALVVLQNGDLIAGGSFTAGNDNPVNYIARWTGSTWVPLGTGMNNVVNCLTVMQNGDLVAGGFFNTAGGVTVNRIARWNGTNWFALGTGVGNIVYDVCVMPNNDLIACGTFTTAGGTLVNRIARWNGTAWSAMGGANSNVFSLCVTPTGDLVAGGQFTFIGTTGANRIAMRNTSTGVWTPLGGGITGSVWDLTYLENGDLIASGQFVNPANFIARWAGNAWHTMETGMDAGVLSLLPGSDGLLAGGEFTVAGSVATSCLARWAGAPAPRYLQQPSSQSTCVSGSATFTVAGDGSGPYTYAWEAELDPGIWTLIEDGVLVHGGIILGAASGATTPSLLIDGLTQFAEDRPFLNIRCNLNDACGSTTSDVATMTVWSIATGDANGDGQCDGRDIASFVESVIGGIFHGVGYCACDFSADGIVTAADASGLISHMLSQ